MAEDKYYISTKNEIVYPEELRIGDEVQYHGSGKCFVVTHIEKNGMIGGIGPNGFCFATKNRTKWKRTGRYFPEVLKLLTAMQKVQEKIEGGENNANNYSIDQRV